MLGTLAEEWVEVLKATRLDLIALGHQISGRDMEALLCSVKFLIYSASYQTLPLARGSVGRAPKGYMLSQTLR